MLQREWDPTDQNAVEAFISEFEDTPIGQTLTEEGLTTGEHLLKIRKATEARVGKQFTLGQFVQVAKQMLLAGELLPEPEVIEPPVPRDKNGKPLTQAQIAWGQQQREYQEFTNKNSSQACIARSRVDEGYAKFLHNSNVQEMAHEISGAVIPVGDQLEPISANSELREFARRYSAAPAQSLKPRGGYVYLEGYDTPIPYEKFVTLVEKASAARLIF
jgi:hypothetical protein